MSENTLLRIAGIIWTLIAIISVAQHEWYHAMLESSLGALMLVWSFDENQ